METELKRKKVEGEGEVKKKLIGTHNGTFHCDEALACYLLLQTDEFQEADILRTRDEKLLQNCDILVDVGGQYDAEKRKFDHHQPTFSGKWSERHKVKLSSAGLVYKHFGLLVVQRRLAEKWSSLSLSPPAVVEALYDEFFLEQDAIDNGVESSEGKKEYSITTHLAARVGRLNGTWLHPVADKDAAFRAAVAMAGAEFESQLNSVVARVAAESEVEAALLARPFPFVLLLPRYLPWKDSLFALEARLSLPPLLYVVFPEEGGEGWRVQAVPEEGTSFKLRKRLPLRWAGLRSEALSAAASIPRCVFCHVSGFIAGNETKEGAVAMACAAVENPDSSN